MADHIEASSGNVYADMGRSDASEMLLKAQLAAKITDIIRDNHFTQMQAAELLGIPQSKLSDLMRGKFRGISELKMLECLLRLGRSVEIVVGKAGSAPSVPNPAPTVVFAG